jgi:hypothetical protein
MVQALDGGDVRSRDHQRQGIETAGVTIIKTDCDVQVNPVQLHAPQGRIKAQPDLRADLREFESVRRQPLGIYSKAPIGLYDFFCVVRRRIR